MRIAFPEKTLCEKLKNDPYRFIHLSTGDLLRDEVQRKTPIGRYAETTMAAGGLVNKNVMLYLLNQAMLKHQHEKKPYLLDGERGLAINVGRDILQPSAANF